MNAYHLVVDVFLGPLELDVVLSQSLPEISCEVLVLHDACQSLFYSFCLLLHKLNCVGQENYFLACSVFAKVVVHRANRYSCLSCPCWKVNDAVAVL